MIKNIIKKAFSLFPFKESVVQFGANLPVKEKNSLTLSFFGLFGEKITTETQLTTNLGISNHYKINLPHTSYGLYLYGNPEMYKGERGVLYLSAELGKTCEGIVDIGANWGYYTYFLKHHCPDKPIFFFEPNHTLFQNIKRNIALNSLLNVKGYENAISSKSGRITFYINKSDDFSSSLTNYFENNGHTIEAVSLDALSFDDFTKVESLNNLLVKVDIEAAEFQFIEGAANSIDRIKYLIIELLEDARKNKFIDILIQNYGYHAYYINDYSLEYVINDDGRYTAPEYNWLFCRENPEELKKTLGKTKFQVKY